MSKPPTGYSMKCGGRIGLDRAVRIRGWFLALAAAVACSAPAAAADGPEAPKLVVVIYPSDYDVAPGIILVNRAIRSTFASGWPSHIDIRNEYVNTNRLHDAEFMAAQIALLRLKYTGQKIDLVIAGLSAGLDFAMRVRGELFPGVPIVFTAVDEREVKARRLPPDAIGVPIRMNLEQTIDLALRLHPETRQVYVVVGSSPFDREWEAEARRTLRSHEDRAEFTYLTGLSVDDLLGRVAALPDHSLVYYLHFHQDNAGKPYFSAEVLERLAAKANAPIYGHVDTYVGRGIVGGHVFRFEETGTDAARLGLRILAGERPESIPVPEASATTLEFDWRQLQRWGIRESSLPPGSVVLFRESTVWDRYKWHIFAAASFCVLQAVLILGLLAQRAKRRRAVDQFRQVVESSPSGMLVVGRDGIIVMVNAQVEHLFGSTRGELIGRPIETLVPERSRAVHPAARAGFFAAPVVRPMGLGRDLFGRRKDGSEFPVEIGLSPLQTPRGLFVLASVIDLSERRRAEERLQSNQRELQVLTGRLLEAHEFERRRVARELHDDLSQGLALLAVELDLLLRRPPATHDQTVERVGELSARVKELSSSVHDLSHRLHPSRLEHLGLVAAIRGLCRELLQHHGMDAKFTHYDVPEIVPEATALCLYRIAQESLRNVIKHSGTAHAQVELSGSGAGIRLRVSDDGAGFDPEVIARGGGLGLLSMRERLHLIGGRIAIDTRPGGGTRIEVYVPGSETRP